LEAIRTADVITVGPGSLYTSLIPNLLVKGIAGAVRRSPAVKIYVGNLMTQPGETTGFTAADHLEAISCHAGGGLFDGVILNSAAMESSVLARYRREGASPVPSDLRRIRSMGLKVMRRSLLARERVVRHDPVLLARTVQEAYRKWHAGSVPWPRRVRRDGRLV
jgi:uncharacterized cofD-like protein